MSNARQLYAEAQVCRVRGVLKRTFWRGLRGSPASRPTAVRLVGFCRLVAFCGYMYGGRVGIHAVRFKPGVSPLRHSKPVARLLVQALAIRPLDPGVEATRILEKALDFVKQVRTQGIIL